jgi:hydroxymethylglutaryl-CoA synthase
VAEQASTEVGISAIGTYLPRFQLDLADVAATLGSAGGTGRRLIAGYDEDTATMAVEALRTAGADRGQVDELIFATASPPYFQRTNASIVHAALDLPEHVPAGDVIGGTRSWSTALRLALATARRGHVVAVGSADIVVSRPASPDEAEGGDAAAAVLVTAGNPAAAWIGGVTRTFEVLNRWQPPSERFPQRWEERFVEAIYAPYVLPAVTEALTAAGLKGTDVDFCVLSGGPGRLLASLRRRLPGEQMLDHEKDSWGNSAGTLGAVLLARTLSRTPPGSLVLCVHVGDGVDVDLWRVNAAPAGADAVRADPPPPRPVPYGRYLSWRGLIEVEPPRRPSPVRPAAPPSWRNRRWKYGSVASRCTRCGHVNAPPGEVCSDCGNREDFEPQRLAAAGGVAAEVTVDHLAYSLSPPIIAGNVIPDAGGRIQIEMTDCRPDDVHDGTRVEFVFRRLYSAEGVHDYFWKVRPVL